MTDALVPVVCLNHPKRAALFESLLIDIIIVWRCAGLHQSISIFIFLLDRLLLLLHVTLVIALFCCQTAPDVWRRGAAHVES